MNHRFLVTGLLFSQLLFACSDDDPGDPPDEESWAFEEIALDETPTEITDFVFVPDSDRFFVVTRTGSFYEFELTEDEAELVTMFEVPDVYTRLDCGLISIALAPDFATSGEIYLGFCTGELSSGVFRFDYDEREESPIPITEIIELEEPDANEPWHNVGAIDFDETGALFALFGDKTVRENGQDATEPLGSLIRIMPGGDGDYTIPEDNPFVDDEDVDDRIFAYGIRSPWQGFLDSESRFWIGDVGSSAFEEVNVVTEPGQNFGWGDHEGPCQADCDDITDPVAYWNRSDSHEYVLEDPEATSASARVGWVGLEYPADENDEDPYDGELDGGVLFGDMCVGFVRALTLDDDDEVASDEAIGHLANATGWSLGPGGFVYASVFGNRCTTGNDIEYGDGRIMRLVRE